MAQFQRPTLCCCRKVLTVPSKSCEGGQGLGQCRLVDIASASNFHCFKLRHFHLDLRLNFAVKEITGWQVLELVAIQPGVQTLVLDTHPSLLIHSIDCKVPGTTGAQNISPSLTYRVDPFTDYGSSLNISLPAYVIRPHRAFQITVRYTTTDGPAIWWLDAELTCGQTRPLVFTQGHSVCNRSFFPCFDTPAVKSTYTATVRVPEGVTVLMSASRSAYSKQDRVFQFSMEYPVPAYLVALVAGDLQHVDIGPRYDIVFLPPSFPIVAMENPCLTFIISSILESREFLLIDVIHEIAHGWFGNAVTNATWEEMWLSEGLATYAQRRITTEAYGEAFTCLETVFRLDALHRQMRLLGDNNPVSKLQVKFEPGINPSSLMNLFTYEKGFCFVSYLSQLCGNVKRFDSFLRAYIEQFKFSSVVAQDLLDFFLGFFPELKESCVAQREGLEFERWLNGCGPPLCEPDLSAGGVLTGPVQSLCDLWASEPPDPEAIANFNLSSWSTFQTVLFLDRLLDRSPLSHEVMGQLSRCYSAQLDEMNAEVRIRWLQIVVRNSFYPDLPRIRGFLHKHTSRMYTVPLYEDLCSGVMKCFAAEVFYQTQARLHPNLRRTLQQILFQTSALPTPTSSVPSLLHPTPSSPSPTPSDQLGPADPPTTGTIALRDVNVSA
ncbi:aminopeptidase RNPEPL1 isoform X2 [Salvelinus fontinalis]|uniref:aminopeptidase RNPEPL1 isoform X2 n=1 Tax=Salvelinus fontinalis TaxID=8038 RepID=UPI0024853C94|nr:aminopeptidase RNPEPL1 isoform X2 [Salvelinus fontinalis]